MKLMHAQISLDCGEQSVTKQNVWAKGNICESWKIKQFKNKLAVVLTKNNAKN